MRMGTLCVAAIMAAGWSAASVAGSDETEAMQPVRHFFNAFGRRDKAGMLAEVVPNAELTSERQGELRRMTVEALADRIAAFQGGALAETLRDPIIHVDGTLGIVWAPYVFSIDGKPNHCGTDVITLLKLQGRWQIVAIADNQHESCG